MTTLDEIMLLADEYADKRGLFEEEQAYLSDIEKARAALVTALEELIAESQREIDGVRDDAAFLISQKLKEAQAMKSTSWMDCEGVPV